MFHSTLHRLVQFLRRENGPTAVEYAVMLGLIILVTFFAIAVFGTKVSGLFTSIDQTIDATGGSS